MISLEFLRYRTIAIDALTIKPGITTIIGANGGGKTTFLKLCAGIALPDSGTIMIDDAPPRETEIGWVNEFPDRNILFVNVFDEIASPLRFRSTPCDEIDSNVRACAEAMGITHLLKRMVRELSGGEKVLVSLAAALVHHPKVLVLDEYDSHLDARSMAKNEQIIRSSGADYIIRCTQQMDIAIHSDYLLFFDSGRITRAGTPDHVFPFLKGTAYYPVLWEC
ncbi:MAG TPA: energy-coupling factor ABC transporter ATP-binding protein [Methanoregula sp.]|nr:energy-coupling factor ABC transporter ATP-binding protein [Methanoregula sp.]